MSDVENDNLKKNIPEASNNDEEEIPSEGISPGPESRSERLKRLAFRWFLGVIIVFGLGFLTATLTLYQGERKKLSQTSTELNTAIIQIANLQVKVTELQGDVSYYSTFEKANQYLEAELDSVILHLTILSIRADVYEGLLALYGNNSAKARLALDNTPDTLESLESMLKPEHRDLVKKMQERLNLALNEIGTDTYATQSDLDVLATNLVELENAFFTSP